MDSRRLTTLLIYFAAIIEKADEQVLPAVYFFAGKSWGATPMHLGQITLCRALVQALASPLSGVYGDKYDRITVIAIGCFIWGVMTSAIAVCSTVGQAMICAAANGLGLSLVIPCSQSVIADLYSRTYRGRAFGLMQLVSAAGVVGGGLFATNMGHYSMLGMDGWRCALHFVAIISILTGVLVWIYGIDPRTETAHDSRSHDDMESAKLLPSNTARIERRDPASTAVRISCALAGSVWKDLMKILRIPSFRYIILQGVVGTLPWNAMVFYTLWFQLLGFSDFSSSALVSAFNVGCAMGGVIGGSVSDALASKFPDAGRVMTAQLSCLLGFPLFFILFKILPSLYSPLKVYAFAVVLLILGSSISWCGSGCNAPMFSELVPKALYSKIFAFDRSFEGAIASMAAPLVGHVAERYFGFTGAIGEDKANQTSNALALGNSLFACITIPLMVCCLSYSALYWSFPRDRRRAKEQH